LINRECSFLIAHRLHRTALPPYNPLNKLA
jgi:hypothetical protein